MFFLEQQFLLHLEQPFEVAGVGVVHLVIMLFLLLGCWWAWKGGSLICNFGLAENGNIMIDIGNILIINN